MISAALAVAAIATTPLQQSAESTERRLQALCRLWGKVKFSHPATGYESGVDWDAALVETLPKVRSARSTQDYRLAVQGMLSTLGDAGTGIVSKEDPVRAPTGFRFRREGARGILEAGNYAALFSPEAQKGISDAIAAIPSLEGLIIDLRNMEDPGDYGKFALASSFAPIERAVTKARLEPAGLRRRVHFGFPSRSAYSSGQYRTGFFTEAKAPIPPAANATDLRCVFLMNRHSGVLPSIAPLQSLRRAAVVFDGLFDLPSPYSQRVDLGEGETALVRTAEPVLPDGTSGDLVADVSILQHLSPDNAMSAAVKLATSPLPPKVQRKALAATGSPPADKSYPQMRYPSEEYRLLGLFRLWNTIEYFYPYKALLDKPWNAVLEESIPKFRAARDAKEYTLAVADLARSLSDSHAYVASAEMDDIIGAGYPPIRTRRIEGKAVVSALPHGPIEGVKIGDVIVRVDGEAAVERLARYEKLMSGSTLESAWNKAALQFMNGPVGSSSVLAIQSADEAEREVSLERKKEDYTTLYHRERSGEIVQLLTSEVGYMDLDRLTAPMVDEALERLKNTKAIIFDMRGYPNDTAWLIAPRLASKPDTLAALLETPIIGDLPPFSGAAIYQTVGATTSPRYAGKTLMLIDERTQSQAEHTGLYFRAANGTTFVGSPTAGANGEITSVVLPGAITVGFTGQSVRWPDGRQLQRVGIQPDVLVRPTIKGLQAGRDEVLEKALEFLRE